MKVVSYNCYEGAQDTRDILLGAIDGLKPDILQLQEINEWGEGSPSPFQLLAKRANFETSVFGDSNTRFKLGTLASRAPLDSEVLTEGFWHSAIHTELPFRGSTLHMWNVHLNPQHEDNRLPEVENVLRQIDLESYALITGDFNSLAESDGYDEQDLLARFNAQGLKKFGEAALRFDVIKRLTDAGLVDIGARYSWQNTVPTPANTDAAHAAQLRLDYAFATPRLAALVSDYRVVKNKLTDHASDHYPIEIIIDE
jgi:endonuclease/exonuclease/phosphatase family metal-dependent hydrolase